MTSAATDNPSRRPRRLGQRTADPHQAAIRLLSGSPRVATAYILPSALIYGLFIFLPILASLGLSLTSWDGLSRPQFIGLGNYLRLSNDPQFWTSLENNGTFILFYAVLPLGFGLLLTAAIGAVTPRERTGFRFLLFLPYVLPMALVGIIWQWLYNPAFGPIAQSLRQFGLGTWAIPFLGSFDAALPAVGFVATWSLCGFCMVLLLSGVQRLDPHLFEAAELDGATRMEVLRHITIPGLVPEIRIALLLTVIASIKAFDLIFVMTRGGPGTSTLVTSIYMYENGFRLGAFGYSAAVAVIGAGPGADRQSGHSHSAAGPLMARRPALTPRLLLWVFTPSDHRPLRAGHHDLAQKRGPMSSPAPSLFRRSCISATTSPPGNRGGFRPISSIPSSWLLAC